MSFFFFRRIIGERGGAMDKGADSYLKYLRGDDSGLAEIIREYKDGLILYLNSFVCNICTAEELTEDTFVKLGIKKPLYNSKKASFKTWLYTMARNTVLDYLRHSARKAEMPIDECCDFSDEESLEHAYIRKEHRIAVRRTLRRVSPQYRQIIWLIYFENFSISEAAAIMKKSRHSTETLVYRARLSLKTELEKEGFEYEDL